MTPGRRCRAVAAATLLVAAPAIPAADGAAYSRAELRADQQFATYAYAHEFGSGVYDISGRTLQVYTLPFGWWARRADARGPGLHLRLPVTLGFLDFQSTDVITTGLPDSVDSLSFVPGIELECRLTEHWTLMPYVQAGASVADEAEVETRLFGAGARAEHTFSMGDYAGAYVGELAYSAVRYRGDLPDDDFVRWRNGVTLFRGTTGRLRGRPVEVGGFALVDAYLDPPTGPATGVEAATVQMELGLEFGTRPMPTVWGLSLPRVGLSYRFAGDLSGFRFVLGAPF